MDSWAGAEGESEAANVLVLASGSSEQRRDVALGGLSEFDPTTTTVLVVTYANPAAWREGWAERVGAPPAHGGIISVGKAEADHPQSGGSVWSEDDADGNGWAHSGVEDPGDLTGIGIELSELLSDLDAVSGDGDSLVVCFDSLTDMLGHAELERAFRFLHVATARVTKGDARGYFLLDPTAHDGETRGTIEGLFDRTIEAGE